jgi:tetratricopeptide (TPR) repeat protein
VNATIRHSTRALGLQVLLSLLLLISLGVWPAMGTQVADAFGRGLLAFESGKYAEAARDFQGVALSAPSVGAFNNLGLCEWRRGRAGAAIQSWEQARWIAPWDADARAGLLYARRLLDLESPNLRWHERVSEWMPANAWAWVTTIGLWLTVGALLMPEILRRRRTSVSQGVAAIGLMILLLSLPAQWGAMTRMNIGFVLQRQSPLRLTPTLDGEITAKLPAGEPAREVRRHGDFLLVTTPRGDGWMQAEHFGRIVQK